MPSEDELSKAVNEILGSNDLEKITLRMVMDMLCVQFSLPREHLNQQKPFVRNIIKDYLAKSYNPDPNDVKQEDAEEEDDEEDDDVEEEENDDEDDADNKARNKRKRSSVSNKQKKKSARPRPSSSNGNNANKEIKLTGLERAVVLAEPLVEFFGDRVIARSHIPKRIASYAKEHNLRDPNDGRRIICDDRLKKALHVDNFTYFSLPKLISNLVFKPEDCDEELQSIAKECESKLIEEKRKNLIESIDNNSSSDNINTSNVSSKRARKKQKTENDDGENKPKKPSALLRPMQLSDALIAVVGESQLPRSEVLKRLWNYIRENNLKDPNNSKQILCDDKLKAVFDGNSSVSNLAILKHISAHMTKIEGV